MNEWTPNHQTRYETFCHKLNFILLQANDDDYDFNDINDFNDYNDRALNWADHWHFYIWSDQ